MPAPALSPAVHRRAWSAWASMGSAATALSLAIPLATAYAWSAVANPGAPAVLATRAGAAWTIALAVSLGAAALRAARERREAAALAAAGLLLLVAQAGIAQALRFDGRSQAGEGEQAAAWSAPGSGALARAPDLAVQEVPPGEDAVVRLRLGGVPVLAPPGGPPRTSGSRVYGFRTSVGVEEVGPAPRVVIRDGAGDVLADGLAKVSSDPDVYLEFGTLPHRFHLTPATTSTAEGDDLLHVRIERGKLLVLDLEAPRHAQLGFEGLTFAWGEGARWARVHVVREPPWTAGIGGGALLAAAALVAALRRRRP